jgi:hypothetical protein
MRGRLQRGSRFIRRRGPCGNYLILFTSTELNIEIPVGIHPRPFGRNNGSTLWQTNPNAIASHITNIDPMSL